MNKELPEKMTGDKRVEPRLNEIRNYRVEIKLIGEPIYQFRVVEVSNKGAGLLVKDDSDFLNMIKVNQLVDANFISPKGAKPSGMYKTEIKHITKPAQDSNKGHCLVGISILKKLNWP